MITYAKKYLSKTSSQGRGGGGGSATCSLMLIINNYGILINLI